MKFEPCVFCSSNNVEEILCDGYFEFEGNRYPLKTKYLKCKDCSTEYIGQHQIKENQEYLKTVTLNSEKTKPH
jgi:hypothetical protein